jgi:DNA polymerase-3 subunit epsilon
MSLPSSPAATRLPPRLAVVDLETTGTDATRDRVTEIGIVCVENGVVAEEWSSLVNPEEPIPAEIQALTGITDAMVRNAPTFGELYDEVVKRLGDCVFVAHNARFDYGFIKNEMRRLGAKYTADVLCTVRLSRRLEPERAQHGLDAIVERHGLMAEGRHRAMGDARLAWQFLHKMARDYPDDIAGAVKGLLRIPSLPPQLAPDALAGLPEGPGVYVFYGVSELPLYIGKSINLRDRVRAHFSSDHMSANDSRLALEIRRIDFEETAGELGALIRESQLVKQSTPLLNRMLRRNGELAFVRLRDLSRPPEFVKLADFDLGDTESLYGPFSSRSRAREVLAALAADNSLCWRALGVQRGDGACFARQLKRCRGACVGEESIAEHHARLIPALAPYRFPAWPHAGAVAIREQHPDHGWERLHVVDRWCYVGTATDEAELAELAARCECSLEARFDPDIFRLLVKRLGRASTSVVPLTGRATDPGAESGA